MAGVPIKIKEKFSDPLNRVFVKRLTIFPRVLHSPRGRRPESTFHAFRNETRISPSLLFLFTVRAVDAYASERAITRVQDFLGSCLCLGERDYHRRYHH